MRKESTKVFSYTAVFLSGIILVIILTSTFRQRARIATLETGTPLPKIEFYSPDDKPILAEQLLGKPTILLFFSLDCPHCKKEIKNYIALHPFLKKTTTIVVISVSEVASTLALLTELNSSLTVLFDKNKKSKQLLKVVAYPTTIFVDAEGIIRQTHLGENLSVTSANSMRQYLEAVFGPRLKKRDAVIFQKSENDCGVAALEMILNHFGIQASEQLLDSVKNKAVDGLSMLVVQEISQSAGLKADGWKYTFEDFVQCPKPAMVLLGGNHFAVADSASRVGIVYLRDPARGRVELNRGEFEHTWDGRTLVFHMN